MRIYILIILAIVGFSCQVLKKNKVPFYAIDKSAGIAFVVGSYDQDTLSLKINDVKILNNQVFNNDDQGLNDPNIHLELRSDSIVLFRDLEVDSSFYDSNPDKKTISFGVRVNEKVFEGSFVLRKGKHFLISYEAFGVTANREPIMRIWISQHKEPLYFE